MRELFILPFDHRNSFMKIIGVPSPPSEEGIAKAKEYKKVIYDGFQKALEDGVPKDKAGILVDEWLGKDILTDASSKGFIVCNSMEKSGQEEFDFERGDWQKQIEEINPTYAKVLVRYNPEGDKEMNSRQAKRLATLSDFLKPRENGYLFELLVPATDDQLEKAGSQEAYEQETRPNLMIQAIKEIQEAGNDPIVWKLEGLDSTEKMQMVADQVTSFNKDSGIIILGRGESAEKAEHWLKMGAKVEAAIGFAVGRTVFKDALGDYAAGKIDRDAAVKQISDNYSFFVNVWQKVKSE